MKKFLLGTVALVALGATAPALAADLPARTAAPEEAVARKFFTTVSTLFFKDAGSVPLFGPPETAKER